MAPVVVGQQPRAIVISPNMFSGDENQKILDSGELPKYAVGLFESNGPGPRKRKRLTHLTPEEKIMRRKLKNRVAAQTARDRKKARLETLEEAVNKIHEQTKKLLDINSQLIKRTETLEQENEILRQRLGLEVTGSFTQEKLGELSTIKREFNEIVSLQNTANKERVRTESSDDEGYCILTPYEDDNVTVEGRSCAGVSSHEASKCVSPVPAAGSCQPSEADPLASQTQSNPITTSNENENIVPEKDDTDITSLLRALEAVNPEECLLSSVSSEEGSTSRSSKAVVQESSAMKIKVPINVFRDHEYTKSMPCVFYREDTQDCSSSTKFAVIQTSTTTDSKKLTALIEEPRKCTQELELQIPNELMDAIAPYGEKASASEPYGDDMDMEAVLDSLMSENCGLNPDLPDRLSPTLSETESDSGLSSCGSLLNTPSPLSDTIDIFDAGVDCSSIWDNQLTTDLFPQLAAM